MPISPHLVEVDTIRTQTAAGCPICNDAGTVAYEGLKDRLFGVPGTWSLRKCNQVNCQTYWLDPRPVDADLPKLYGNYYTHNEVASSRRGGARSALKELWLRAGQGYVARRFGYRTPALSLLDRVSGWLISVNRVWCANLDFSVFYLQAKPGGRLVEVGFGNGAMLSDMAALGWRVTGVEFDSKAVAQASKAGLDVRCGNLADQGFPDNSFDAIVMSHVIEHVPDPLGLLTECRRVLKADGTLVLITPNTTGVIHRRFGQAFLHLDPPRHLNLFTKKSLRRLAEQAGLGRVHARTSVRGFGSLWMASRDIERTGRYEWGARLRLFDRLRAGGLGFLFGWASTLGLCDGDELVVVASKNDEA